LGLLVPGPGRVGPEASFPRLIDVGKLIPGPGLVVPGMSKLWLLREVEGTSYVQYDCARAFVVRAKGKKVWLNPKRSTCVPVPEDGPDGVILRDFAAG
jgi:hypothetical protein